MNRFRLFNVLAVLLIIGAALWNGGVTVPVEAAILLKQVGASGTITGGGNITIKVVLTGRATSDTSVGLKSNRPSVLTPPSTLTVPRGSSSASVIVTTRASNQEASVVITASLASIKQTATVLVKPPALSSVALPATIDSGGRGNLTVRLNSVAPSGGMQVAVKSSRSGVFTNLPSSVKVPGGATGIAFQLTAEFISSDTSVTLTGTLNGISKTDTVVINSGSEPTATATKTSVPPTVTSTVVPPTPTNTAVQPTATKTPAQPTATNTSVPPTATNTPVPPTSTSTPVPPTATSTATAIPPTAALTCNKDRFVTPPSGEQVPSGYYIAICQLVLSGPAQSSITFQPQSTYEGLSLPTSVTIPAGSTTVQFNIVCIDITLTNVRHFVRFTGGGITSSSALFLINWLV